MIVLALLPSTALAASFTRATGASEQVSFSIDNEVDCLPGMSDTAEDSKVFRYELSLSAAEMAQVYAGTGTATLNFTNSGGSTPGSPGTTSLLTAGKYWAVDATTRVDLVAVTSGGTTTHLYQPVLTKTDSACVMNGTVPGRSCGTAQTVSGQAIVATSTVPSISFDFVREMVCDLFPEGPPSGSTQFQFRVYVDAEVECQATSSSTRVKTAVSLVRPTPSVTFSSSATVASCADADPATAYFGNACDGTELPEDAGLTMMPVEDVDSVCSLNAYTGEWSFPDLSTIWPPVGPSPGSASPNTDIDFRAFLDAGTTCVDASAPAISARSSGDLVLTDFEAPDVTYGASSEVSIRGHAVDEPCVTVGYTFIGADACGVAGPTEAECGVDVIEQADALKGGLPDLCGQGSAVAASVQEWVAMHRGFQNSATFGAFGLPVCSPPDPYVAAPGELLGEVIPVDDGARLSFAIGVGDELIGEVDVCPVDAYLPTSDPMSIPTSLVESLMEIPTDREPGEMDLPLICIEP